MQLHIDKKVLKNMDYNLLITTIILSFIGLVTISSATKAFSGGSIKMLATQIVSLIISIIIGFIILKMDYYMIGNYYNILYIASLLLLTLVLIPHIGVKANGARSWFVFGPIRFQPSEFAKITTIISIAKVMEDMDDINKPKNLFKIAIYAIIPMLLIELENDTGTVIIYLVTIAGMLFVAGLNMKLIIGAVSAVLFGGIGIWLSGILPPAQSHRIEVFLNPDADKLGKGYNAYQARLAISSGKFFGRGLYQGVLTRGNFIPKCETDFIFSVFSEEWGFLGSAVLIALYANLAFRSVNIARKAKDKFGRYMISGFITMIVFQVLQNIGMDIHLMPVTGIPLPFMSYGGTSLLTNFMAVAFILNVGMRKVKINF